jgi:hypothetical protein
MGRPHRAAYFLIGAAAIAFALTASSPTRAERMLVAAFGAVTLASSFAGY